MDWPAKALYREYRYEKISTHSLAAALLWPGCSNACEERTATASLPTPSSLKFRRLIQQNRFHRGLYGDALPTENSCISWACPTKGLPYTPNAARLAGGDLRASYRRAIRVTGIAHETMHRRICMSGYRIADASMKSWISPPLSELRCNDPSSGVVAESD